MEPLGNAVYSAADYVLYSGILGDVWVVDGDTFDIGRVRYRRHGFDAPEVGQERKNAIGWLCDCGNAVVALSALLRGRVVTCEERERDCYQCFVAVCYAGAYDLGS